MVPEGWHSRPLSEVCELINGRGFKPHEWQDSGYPIIRIQNLNGSSEFNYYDGDFNPKILVKNGQLLFAWSGSRGTSFGPHVWAGPDAVLNYHTWKVVAKPGTDRDFLRNLLQYITVQIEHSAHGAAALVHVQKADMERRRLTVPPLPEQKKIAEILSTWDKAIETTEKLLANAEAQKRALMQQLLTGKRRMKSEGKREWATVRLGDICRVTTGQPAPPPEAFSPDGEPFLRVSNLQGLLDGGSELDAERVSQDCIRDYRLRQFPEGTVIFAKSGMSAKLDRVYRLQRPAYLVSHLAAVEPDRKKVDERFVQYQLEVNPPSSLIQGEGFPSIKTSEIASKPMHMPGLAEQIAIAECIECAQREVETQRRGKDILLAEKQALMQQLLTGKKRVKV